ncbi:RagB/SusD family nutrient uptake outer membrane protein [Gillisia sp. Hel_I_29]|uniref:RagB/SusD family nutrient uptake outer membrane protein n=1 Tax=Gillisia sp. Hel_I_29 TaxID=1249975 RepID=UPI000A583620|nr:RagB/SusD family nutrient uptake outer membrane protein [Gillisia sp. Hel_I_29]
MKIKIYTYKTVIALLGFLLFSCDDFVEVPAPNNKLIRDDVFRSEETAISALKGIYNQLFVAAFCNGSKSSVTVLAGLSADNIQSLRTSNVEWMQFQENELTPDNQSNFELWQGAYQIIYLTNSFLEGVASAEDLPTDLKLRLEGEARFVRAFAYFYLVNLYGDVPLVLSSNYRNNELASRTPSDEIYNQIIADLEISREVLESEYPTGERIHANYYTATSLLSRVYLYLENWSLAESLSTEVIQANSSYEILNNLNEVFLANSSEAIWQISPIGNGEMTTHTREGNFLSLIRYFIFLPRLKYPEIYMLPSVLRIKD